MTSRTSRFFSTCSQALGPSSWLGPLCLPASINSISASLTPRCSEGLSLAYHHHSTATPSAVGANQRKDSRQPNCRIIQVRAGAVAAKPSVRPVLDNPVGNAQPPTGNQRCTKLLTVGKIGAWAAPTRKRITMRLPMISQGAAAPGPGTAAVATVSTAQAMAISIRARRGPNLSANTPPGN